MAESETGWTEDFPEAQGWYWLRGWGQYRTMPVEVNGDQFWSMFNLSPRHRSELDSSSAEFLGPISPTDAEQLSELRKVAQIAATWIEQSLFDIPHDEQGGTVVASLRGALNPKQPEKETK